MVFTDLLWNIRIEINVSGLGSVRHGDFAIAWADVAFSRSRLQNFPRSGLRRAASSGPSGEVALFVCAGNRGLPRHSRE